MIAATPMGSSLMEMGLVRPRGKAEGLLAADLGGDGGDGLPALRRARVAGEDRRAAGVGEAGAPEDLRAALGVVAGAGGDEGAEGVGLELVGLRVAAARRDRRRCPSACSIAWSEAGPP